MKFLAITGVLLSSMVAVSTARAESMSCYLGVYKAADMLSEDPAALKNTTIIAKVPLVGGDGDQEFQVNGETVSVSLSKKQYSDLYTASIVLSTPVADRIRGPAAVVAFLDDYLYSEGPAKENGWYPPHAAGATEFAWLNRSTGTMALAPKAIAALKAAGQWGGKNPIGSSQIELSASEYVRDFVIEQLNAKQMNPDDVIGVATTFSCVLEN